MTRRYRPEVVSGSLITHTISIRCAHCDAIFLDPRGSEIVENTPESFRAMPRTLVCLSCCHRFVKPIPLGWTDHPLAHALRTPMRQRPTPGDGRPRPNAHTSQWPIAARQASERLDQVFRVVRDEDARQRPI